MQSAGLHGVFHRLSWSGGRVLLCLEANASAEAVTHFPNDLVIQEVKACVIYSASLGWECVVQRRTKQSSHLAFLCSICSFNILSHVLQGGFKQHTSSHSAPHYHFPVLATMSLVVHIQALGPYSLPAKAYLVHSGTSTILRELKFSMCT